MQQPFKNLGQVVPTREVNPGHSCWPLVWVILTKFALNSATGTFGCPKRAIPPCHRTTNKEAVTQNFQNDFSRAKSVPQFGFLPFKFAKRAGKNPKTKTTPKGGGIAQGTSPIERWFDANDSKWKTKTCLGRYCIRHDGVIHYCKPLHIISCAKIKHTSLRFALASTLLLYPASIQCLSRL